MEAAKKIFTRAHIIWFLLLNFGLVLLAAGIHFFKSPTNFAMGGTSGISIIAATLLPHMDVGTFMFIINGVLIVLGLVFLGRAVIGATLYSSVALSFYVWVLERAVPMARPFTDDTFLELLSLIHISSFWLPVVTLCIAARRRKTASPRQ